MKHYMTNAKLLREACEGLGLQVWGGENAPYVWVGCPEGVEAECSTRCSKVRKSWSWVPDLERRAKGKLGSPFNSRENVEKFAAVLPKWSRQTS